MFRSACSSRLARAEASSSRFMLVDQNLGASMTNSTTMSRYQLASKSLSLDDLNSLLQRCMKAKSSSLSRQAHAMLITTGAGRSSPSLSSTRRLLRELRRLGRREARVRRDSAPQRVRAELDGLDLGVQWGSRGGIWVLRFDAETGSDVQ
ncbi:hypothetical protein NL676_031464 [Syzygium grande]|nr:hypothetical protein NL676_031464 [Syzygium grande]